MDDIKQGFDNFKELLKSKGGIILIAIVASLALLVVSVFKIRLWKPKFKRTFNRFRSYRPRFRRFRRRKR